MKRIFLIILALVLTLSLTACGGNNQETPPPEQSTQTENEIESSSGTAADASIIAPPPSSSDNVITDPPSGIHDDGIGEVVALTPDEERYMLAQTTNSWLEMSRQEKDDLVILIGRSLEASDGFIVPDYDELVAMLDHQMEQYFRYSVNESVLATVRDICGVDRIK